MVNDLSDVAKLMFEIINRVCICTVVCIFGILANIINMIVFYKQGFKNTVNISFFGLAISDLFSLAGLLWISITLNPLIATSNLHWSPEEVMYLTGAWPYACFSRITCFITVYLTAERYLSIAFPLKVKNIATRQTATITLCLIYFINLAGLVPEYATSYLGWIWFPDKNETLLGIVFTNSRQSVEGMAFVLHSFLVITSFAGVIIFTTLLVSKLNQSSQWRKDVTSDHGKREALASRDKKTVKMVVLIASVLIACYSPGVVLGLTAFIVGPEFNIRGRYNNICSAVWSTAFTFQSINSSVNIFIYYTMSSKFKALFHLLILNPKLKLSSSCALTTGEGANGSSQITISGCLEQTS